jgi:hypothetical protein
VESVTVPRMSAVVLCAAARWPAVPNPKTIDRASHTGKPKLDSPVHPRTEFLRMDSLWRGEVTLLSLLALFAMNILLKPLRKRAHHRVWVVELIAYWGESASLNLLGSGGKVRDHNGSNHVSY